MEHPVEYDAFFSEDDEEEYRIWLQEKEMEMWLEYQDYQKEVNLANWGVESLDEIGHDH